MNQMSFRAAESLTAGPSGQVRIHPVIRRVRPSRGPAPVRAAGFGSGSGRKRLLQPVVDAIPDPLLKASLREPIAFWGGIVAGAKGRSGVAEALSVAASCFPCNTLLNIGVSSSLFFLVPQQTNAGILKLDLKDDPLKSWVEQTAGVPGIERAQDAAWDQSQANEADPSPPAA